MYIRVTNEQVSLEEPEDTKKFKVVAPGGADVGGALRAAGFGDLDGEEALIDVAAVRRAAEGRVGESWGADFDGMIGYAAQKGWMTDDGARIRAHVEAES